MKHAVRVLLRAIGEDLELLGGDPAVWNLDALHPRGVELRVRALRQAAPGEGDLAGLDPVVALAVVVTLAVRATPQPQLRENLFLQLALLAQLHLVLELIDLLTPGGWDSIAQNLFPGGRSVAHEGVLRVFSGAVLFRLLVMGYSHEHTATLADRQGIGGFSDDAQVEATAFVPGCSGGRSGGCPACLDLAHPKRTGMADICSGRARPRPVKIRSGIGGNLRDPRDGSRARPRRLHPGGRRHRREEAPRFGEEPVDRIRLGRERLRGAHRVGGRVQLRDRTGGGCALNRLERAGE